MELLTSITVRGLSILSTLFVLAVGFMALTALVFYLIDANQSHDAVRRNFPVVGRFRGPRRSCWASPSCVCDVGCRQEQDRHVRAGADALQTIGFGHPGTDAQWIIPRSWRSG